MYVDDTSELGDLAHSAHVPDPCEIDGARGGESGARAPKSVQDPRAPSRIAHGAPTASAGAERLTHIESLGTRSATSQCSIWTVVSWARSTRRPSPTQS